MYNVLYTHFIQPENLVTSLNPQSRQHLVQLHYRNVTVMHVKSSIFSFIYFCQLVIV